MDYLLNRRRPETALDVGCGSAVLAIAFGLATLLLGALAGAHVTVFLVLGLTIGLHAMGLAALALLVAASLSGQDVRVSVESTNCGSGSAAAASHVKIRYMFMDF